MVFEYPGGERRRVDWAGYGYIYGFPSLFFPPLLSPRALYDAARGGK